MLLVLIVNSFDDVFASEVEQTTTSGSSGFASASEVTPKSGIVTWKVLLSNSYKYGVQASSTIPGFSISSTVVCVIQNVFFSIVSY